MYRTEKQANIVLRFAYCKILGGSGYMKHIFVNLKRFDVPRALGGICPSDSPEEWIVSTVKETIELGLGRMDGVRLTYFLPEALLLPAIEVIRSADAGLVGGYRIGSQNVFRQDVKPGGNFGAFTSNRPAAAIKALGCDWAMIGHSEERRDKLEMLGRFAETLKTENSEQAAAQTVEGLLNEELTCALGRGINVLFCVGETAEQKGSDDPAVYEPRVREVLHAQLCTGLRGIADCIGGGEIAIGYEPIWAIGPGKTPPNGEYIAFVSEYIKKVCSEELGMDIPVVYGGGLKEDNARELAGVKSIDGGLVALTKFTQPIAFEVESLKRIIRLYMED